MNKHTGNDICLETLDDAYCTLKEQRACALGDGIITHGLGIMNYNPPRNRLCIQWGWVQIKHGVHYKFDAIVIPGNPSDEIVQSIIEEMFPDEDVAIQRNWANDWYVMRDPKISAMLEIQ